MGRGLLAVVTALLLSLSAPVGAKEQSYGFETITAGATAAAFTATTLEPNGQGNAPQAVSGYCRVAAGQIRFRYDGPAPTSSVGTLAEIGDVIPIRGFLALKNFKAIRTGSTSGVLSCPVNFQ